MSYRLRNGYFTVTRIVAAIGGPNDARAPFANCSGMDSSPQGMRPHAAVAPP
jgi:hypothetical protein